ncbi:outer membrane protein assembly factor BamB family protein [Pseudactinotalea suaedae]|uniref:outer membrane protein assembly factor BamB family protein n=1 Tax=Pseudactinotalea suaedae TaxID=1524924 RepID=UPI0012E1A77F|nr:PQQ-binding-like beta-propeller repeat protein [Pseudactinotalea suaedae]
MAAVDEFDLAEASDDGERAGTPSGRPRRARPWPWALAALALVGLGAANAVPTPIVLGQGQGAEIGLLDLDIGEAPTVVWETALRYPETILADGGRAVVVDNDPRLQGSVLGIDLATGTEIWRFHDEAQTCSRYLPIVCVEDPGSTDAVVVTIDTEDGARQTRSHPGAIAAVLAGDDLAVIEATDVDIENVVLVEPDGTERWRVAADAAETASDPVYAQLRVSSTSVLIDFSAIEIDLVTGAQAPTTRWPLGDGVEVELGSDSTPIVTTADGRFELGPGEAWLSIDDDLGGPIVLTQAGDTLLAASRRIDETELWLRTDEECYFSARLGGTVLAMCWGPQNERVLALDKLTGGTRWELPGAMAIGASREVFLMSDPREGRVLAVDAVDGSTLWSLPVPVGSYASVTELSDGVLLTTDTELMRLQWD